MSGLDSIIKQISDESALEAGQILQKATDECENIRLEYEQKAAKEVLSIQLAGDAEISKIQRSAHSRADANGKQRILEAKHRAVSDVVDGALQSLASLGIDDYFEAMTRLLAKYAHADSGEILLSRSDCGRITPQFKQEIDGRGLTLVPDDTLIGGGFVLKYADIEENCMFKALFSQKNEDIRDRVHAVLFNM